jgi:hypothetical protein
MPWRVGGWFRRKELWAERGGKDGQEMMEMERWPVAEAMGL